MDNNHKDYIAYFSMEVGISYKIPTYSGGLGILAGDTLKSFADIGLPAIGVTLLNEKGYFYQEVDSEGNQIEKPVNWRVNDYLVLLPNIIVVNIEGREVRVRAWKYILRGINGANVPLFFLDTNIKENSDYDRTLTSFLYGGDQKYRLSQEVILGIGGVKMLESLGYHNIRKYHMNEGHAALLTVELLRKTYIDRGTESQNYDLDLVKSKCVFTTHTPVAAGHDKFDKGLFKWVLQDYAPEFVIDMATDHEGFVNMTFLALHMSNFINGVAKRHGEVTRLMFPEYRIDSITNGVHQITWTSASMKEVFDRHIPGWAIDPFTLRYALSIPKKEIWDAHKRAKEELIQEINELKNAGFDTERFTIGYARRFTSYKRPDLILYDIERLKGIADLVGDIQIVFAGKAHPKDTQGKEFIKRIIKLSEQVNSQNKRLKLIFLEHYDMRLAKKMVAGCDVWLNTPQRPYEASGTSGMKAAINGVPQISTLDGWWLEGHVEGITGWSLGAHPHDPNFNYDNDPKDEANDLYEKLPKIVALFYGNKDRWIEMMKHCIAINGSFFNTFRMAQQYIAGAYIE